MKDFFYLAFFSLFHFTGTILAQDVDPFNSPNKMQVRLLSEASSFTADEPFTVAVELIHPKGWHSYYINPGVAGLILETDWTLPAGFNVRHLGWPTPHLSVSSGLKNIGYEGTIHHLYEITPPTDLSIGSESEISVEVSWQICDSNSCRPPNSKSLSLNLTSTNELTIDSAQVALFKTARAHYPLKGTELQTQATEADNVITLQVSPVGDLQTDHLYFFDEDGQVDVQKPHLATKEGDTITIKLPRNQGAGFFEAGPVLDELKGILSDGTHSYFIKTKRTGLVETVTPSEEEHASTPADTEEDITAMAKLYDSSKKIDFISLSKTVETTLWTALVGAFVGGMLLNLMPCVFPVLGLKVMGFVEQAGNDPKKIKLHGIAFTAGLVVSMWVLAGIILFLKLSLGKDVNWGQQMGNPYFVGAIILLLFVLGLNMAGVFEMGTSLTSAGQGVKKKGLSGSFFSGVLTTLIATPCSGPFLGAAMSYTLSQPAFTALFLFTIFALGISLPYLLLSFFPALINKLPRPGAWMETFKITMSFALFATVAFFMKTFGTQTGSDGLSLMVMGLVVIGLALYFFGHWSLPHRKPKVRILAGMLLPLVIAVGGIYLLYTASSTKAPRTEGSSHGWVAWQPGKVESSRAKKRIVWVDYTADW